MYFEKKQKAIIMGIADTATTRYVAPRLVVMSRTADSYATITGRGRLLGELIISMGMR